MANVTYRIGTDNWAALDGRADAPTGAAQYPTLLNGLVTRPPWQVAGVNYRVGVNTGVTLKNPNTDTMPSGVSRNTTTHVMSVTGNNVTLDGWDFTLNGGWHVDNTGANTQIKNCNFSIGNDSAIWSQSGSSNLYLGYCVFDGQGTSDALITMSGDDATVEYCWFKNTAGDTFQLQSPGGGTLVMRYNVIEEAGQGVGSHGDFLQVFTGNPVIATMMFNTTKQTGGFTQGFMLEPDGGPWGAGVITSSVMGNNTFYVTGSDTQYFAMGVTVDDIVATVTVRDNYFSGCALAPGGVRSGPGDASAKTIFTDNINMDTGAVVED
jgi:hypothetical protein